MNQIKLPTDYNYIGVFLTLKCNLNCSYCINKFDECPTTQELSTSDWIRGLSRIKTTKDLPITLSGGEPTIHPGFYEIVDGLYRQNIYLDLLTNGLFDINEFCYRVPTNAFRRGAKYASLRFSFHEGTHPMSLALKVYDMQMKGYEVGIWGVEHPSRVMGEMNKEMTHICKWLNLDFRLKEFLGRWGESFGAHVYGSFKYKDACSKKFKKMVLCKSSELLINPAGFVFRCHRDLYAGENPIGHILEEGLSLYYEGGFGDRFLECKNFGHCSPCDMKVKFDRFQEPGHCAVEIKEVI